MLDDVLKDVLARVEGAKCALLAGRDGVIVASAIARGGPAAEAVAAPLVDLFRRVTTAHRVAGLTPPTEFTSGGGSGAAVMRAVTGQYLLVVVLEGASNMGRTRFELRKAAAAIQPEVV